MQHKTLAALILTAAFAGPAAAQIVITGSPYDSPGAAWEALTPLERDNYNLNFAGLALDQAFRAGAEARQLNSNATAFTWDRYRAAAAEIRDVREFAARGTAIALASTVAMPALASGETGVAVGTGSYDGYGALALNVAHQRGATLYSAGVSTTDDGRTGVRAGAAWKW